LGPSLRVWLGGKVPLDKRGYVPAQQVSGTLGVAVFRREEHGPVLGRLALPARDLQPVRLVAPGRHTDQCRLIAQIVQHADQQRVAAAPV
jgi:hypothetical protein